MTPEEKKQFDSVKQELALFQINQLKINEDLKHGVDLSLVFDRISSLENRVKVLEDARQVQIRLNTEYTRMLDDWKKAGQIWEKAEKSKWSWW